VERQGGWKEGITSAQVPAGPAQCAPAIYGPPFPSCPFCSHSSDCPQGTLEVCKWGRSKVPLSSIACLRRSNQNLRAVDSSHLLYNSIPTLRLLSSSPSSLFSQGDRAIPPFHARETVVPCLLRHFVLFALSRLCRPSSSCLSVCPRHFSGQVTSLKPYCLAMESSLPQNQASDARILREYIEQQDNVPAFMLQSATAILKKTLTAAPVQDQTNAFLGSIDKGVKDLRQKIDNNSLDIIAIRSEQGHLGEGVEKCVIGINTLNESASRQEARVQVAEARIEEHARGLNHQSERLNEHEIRLQLLSQTKDEETERLAAKLAAIEEHLAAMHKAPNSHRNGVPPVEHESGYIKSSQCKIATARPRVPSTLPPTTVDRAVSSRAGVQSQKGQTPVGHLSGGSQTQAGQAASRPVNNPSSIAVPSGKGRHHGRQSKTTTQGGKSVPRPLMVAAPSNPAGTMAASQMPWGPNRAWLHDHLQRALQKHTQCQRAYFRTPDMKFIWDFMDKIEDKEFSRKLQEFLSTKLGDKYARRTRINTRLNRYVTLTDLKWPVFAQAVREFMQADA